MTEERRVTVYRGPRNPPSYYDECVTYDRGPEHSFRRILREERRYPDGTSWAKDYPSRALR